MYPPGNAKALMRSSFTTKKSKSNSPSLACDESCEPSVVKYSVKNGSSMTTPVPAT